jgi:hypothetical protein
MAMHQALTGSDRLDFDAAGFQPAQCEHRVADLHRHRLAAAGAAAQQVQRLARDESQFAEAAQIARIQLRHRRCDRNHAGARTSGQILESHERKC